MPPQHPANDKPNVSFIKRRGIYIPNKSERWKSLKEKTTWDWLQLLIVPVVLTLGGFLFSWQVDLRQERIAEERRQQEVFIGYLDKMGDLLTSKGLRQAKKDGEVIILAQSRTATALRQLDLQRRDLLLNFLRAANLLNSQRKSGILRGAFLGGANFQGTDFSGADLQKANLRQGNLQNANLQNANLLQVNLAETNLIGADLWGAILREADLRGAILWGAILREADLRGAILWGAILSGASFSGADLSGAILVRADLSGANLSGAKGLTSKEVKSATNWEQARYDPDFRKELGLPPEPAPETDNWVPLSKRPKCLQSVNASYSAQHESRSQVLAQTNCH